MMESIIRDNLVSHRLNANLFADEQHGFVPNRDCMTNLLLALEDWSEAIEFDNDIDIIYTDFAKAFESHSKGHSQTHIIRYRRRHITVDKILFNWKAA